MKPHNHYPAAILGGGVTGLTLGLHLAENKIPSIIFEQTPVAGGLAQTIRWNGSSFDVGSHRIHEQYHPEARKLIRDLLGDDLLSRPRHGKIWVNGRFTPYPPEPFDILRASGVLKTAGFLVDHLFCALNKSKTLHPDYETYLSERIGKRLYREFYEPYAIKLWGQPPSSLEADPAEHRVKRFGPARFLKKLLGPSKNVQTYEYPKRGIGQIVEALQSRYLALGGKIIYETEIQNFLIKNTAVEEIRYAAAQNRTVESLKIWALVSTIPLPVLSRLLNGAQSHLTTPDARLEWRGLRLLFIKLPEPPGILHETFYVPDNRFLTGRISEMNLYSPGLNPTPSRALTLEIPCSAGDSIWIKPKEELLGVCLKELFVLGIVKKAYAPHHTESLDAKIPGVYPIYAKDWHGAFEKQYAPVRNLNNVYSIGRSALFLHCNIDHCIVMALRLAEHLSKSESNPIDWHDTIVPEFFKYRVRD